MGHELWISSNTGIRRKGTTFKELQSLFIEQITTKHIYEPLFSAKKEQDAESVRNILEQRDFDTVGVIDEQENIIGYINKSELTNGSVENFTRPIDLSLVVTDSTPISKLIHLFAERSFAFVIHANRVDGIVTKADINKPIVRIYLFGMISLFEMHLNYWINQNHPDEVWRACLSGGRIRKAEEMFELRKGNNQALSLLECLQFCDKRDILVATEVFLKEFSFSPNELFLLLEKIEKIRNELAHSQTSIISNLSWSDFVSTIMHLEKSLFISELKVEENVSNTLKI